MSGLAIVTGAAGGIGTEIATSLAAGGHEVLAVDLAEAVANTSAELSAAGHSASHCIADLTTDEGVAVVEAAVADAAAPLRVLVNNAGITRDGRAGDLSPADFEAVVSVNLVAAMRLTLALENRFDGGGSVINMSSRAGLGNFGQANYVTSKAGLVGFTRGLALQWAPRVRVNAIMPGLIDTPMTQAMPDRVLEKLVSRIPAGRIGTPADIASAVEFLSSEEAGYVTGQVLVACGGRSIGA